MILCLRKFCKLFGCEETKISSYFLNLHWLLSTCSTSKICNKTVCTRILKDHRTDGTRFSRDCPCAFNSPIPSICGPARPGLVSPSRPGQPWAPGISMGMGPGQGQAEMSNGWSKLSKVHGCAEQSCGGLGDRRPQAGLEWGPGLWPQGGGSSWRRRAGTVKSPSALTSLTLLSSACSL